MSNKNLTIGLVAVLVIVLGVAFLKPSNVIVQQGPQDPIGAVSGPDRSYPCESSNGVGKCFEKQSLALATTTVCAIKSPSATSTLVSANVGFTTSTTTKTVVTLAKGTTAYSTSSAVFSQTDVAINSRAYLQYRDQTASSTDSVFGPSTYFVVGIQGGSGAGSAIGHSQTFSNSGACNATFELF